MEKSFIYSLSLQRGFTLIEASITLLLIGILITLALPSLKNFIYRSDDERLRSQLLQAIELAREEARVHGVSTVICKSNDQVHCLSEAKNSLMVFLDEQEDGIVHSQHQILAVMQIVPHGGMLHWRFYPVYRQYLRFSAIDITQTDNGSFWYCYASAATPAWAVILNKSGRTRMAYPNKKGEIKDSQGKPLLC